eukprot:4914213-Prymnesium_polylepis.1
MGAALQPAARRKAAERERHALLAFFRSRDWRLEDLADALVELGWVKSLMKTVPFATAIFEAEQAL